MSNAIRSPISALNLTAKRAGETGADLMIGLKLDRMDGETVRTVRKKGVFVALWYVDCVAGEVPFPANYSTG